MPVRDPTYHLLTKSSGLKVGGADFMIPKVIYEKLNSSVIDMEMFWSQLHACVCPRFMVEEEEGGGVVPGC